MALGSPQPLAEMSTRNLPGGKELSACRSDISQPYGPPQPVKGIALPSVYQSYVLEVNKPNNSR
jgi:hypothetical protein